MKPLYLLLFLILISISCQAQTLPAFRAYNNTSITTKTGVGSITATNVGGNIDSVCKYLQKTYDSFGKINLQYVLNNNDTTVLPIVIKRGISSAILNQTSLSLYDTSALSAALQQISGRGSAEEGPDTCNCGG